MMLHTQSNFRVIAIISTYNEEDVIVPVIDHLINEGVSVYLIDNWSTDCTFDLVNQIDRGVIGKERWPKDGPTTTYDWEEILKRKEELSQELDADWFMHCDADEIHESPWKGIKLRDAIYLVDQQGYNAIDFTVINFYPVDNNYQPGTSLTNYFKYFEFGKHPAYFKQIQGWKKTKERVNLHGSGGHSVKFSNRKIFPCKFLLRHYPIRSQSHGEKKIFQDRKQRFNPLEKKKGWHNHYDSITLKSSFLKSPEELLEFNSNFYSDYFIERLSGIGIIPLEIDNNEKFEKQTAKALTTRLEKQEQTIADLNHELSKIKVSKTWKLTLLFRRIRVILAPPNSRRASLLRGFVNFIFLPYRNIKRR